MQPSARSGENDTLTTLFVSPSGGAFISWTQATVRWILTGMDVRRKDMKMRILIGVGIAVLIIIIVGECPPFPRVPPSVTNIRCSSYRRQEMRCIAQLRHQQRGDRSHPSSYRLFHFYHALRNSLNPPLATSHLPQRYDPSCALPTSPPLTDPHWPLHLSPSFPFLAPPLFLPRRKLHDLRLSPTPSCSYLVPGLPPSLVEIQARFLIPKRSERAPYEREMQR